MRTLANRFFEHYSHEVGHSYFREQIFNYLNTSLKYLFVPAVFNGLKCDHKDFDPEERLWKSPILFLDAIKGVKGQRLNNRILHSEEVRLKNFAEQFEEVSYKWEIPEMYTLLKTKTEDAYGTTYTFLEGIEEKKVDHPLILIFLSLREKLNLRLFKEQGVANHFNFFPVTTANTYCVFVYR